MSPKALYTPLLIALGSCCLLSGFVSDASAVTNDAFINHGTPILSQQTGLSADEAERDLQTQQTAGNIVPKLERQLGEHYAGVWFDLQTDSFHVGVLSQADRTKAEAVMDEAGVLPSTTFEPVTNSWKAVEAAAKSLNTRLGSLVQSQKAMVMTDPRTNGVTIELAANLPSATVAETQAAVSSSSVPTQVLPIAANSLEVTATRCTFPYCERPLRGGIGIISTPEKEVYHLCTAGFFVRDAKGYPYLLTAAHCMYPEGSTYFKDVWGTAYPGGLTGCGLGHTIAQVLANVGDAAVIETEGCEPPKPLTAIAAWNIEQEYYIKPEPYTAYVGLYECHMGQTSEDQCGHVEATNFTVPVDYKEEGKGIIDVEHEDFLCALSKAGDSGGPYAAGHWGTAIETAGNKTSCGSYGDELSYALNLLGVHMPTS